MNWLRLWLRSWLGVDELTQLVARDGVTLSGLSQEIGATLKLQSELRAMLQEVKEVREMLHDPKRVPIKTRTTQQYRALMEVE